MRVVVAITTNKGGLSIPPILEASSKRGAMSEIRRKYDPEFKAGAVRIVHRTR